MGNRCRHIALGLGISIIAAAVSTLASIGTDSISARGDPGNRPKLETAQLTREADQSISKKDLPTTKYQVGTWYFTVWNRSANSFQVQQSRKVYGRSDSWGGVRDYVLKQGKTLFLNQLTGDAVDFSNREPLLGFYDLEDQSIVDQEIIEANSIGLTFFAFYWYIDPLTGAETSASSPVHLFFESKYSDKMRYMLALIDDDESGRSNAMSLETWRSVVVPKIVNYMTNSVYFTLNKRPVFYDFHIKFLDVGIYKEAYRFLREYTRAKLNVDPIIIRVLGPLATAGDVAYTHAQIAPDGFSCFSYDIIGKAEPYRAYSERWIQSVSKQFKWTRDAQSNIFVPCASTGFDPRPWQDISFSRSITVGTSPASFRDHLEKMRSFIDANTVNTLNTIIIYAWNEWGEAAANVEPSKMDGYTYADVVRSVFGLKSR